MQVEARLRAFAALARRGSFSAAADELVISQPAVSKHVAELEAQIGATLVDRSSRGVRLTEAGQFVAEHVLRAEAILAQATRGVASIGRDLSGTLSLGVSGNGMYLLAPALRAFLSAHPDVELRVEITTSGRVTEAIRAHQLEIGVVGGFAAAPEMQAEPLIEDEIVVVASPAQARRIKRTEDLSDVTWIAREEGSSTRAVIEGAWSDLGITPRRRLALPSWEAVKLAVAAETGVAALSRMAVAVEVAAGTLVIVPVRGWKVRRHLTLICARDVPLSPAAARFAEILRGTVAREGSSTRLSRTKTVK